LWRKILKSKYLKLSSVSIAAKESMEEFLNKDKKVSVITHSVDRSYFYKKKNKNNKLKILYVGRIVKEKGIDIIKKLILLDKNKNFDFTLVGNGKDEYILEDIIERENVHYLGKIKDKNILGDIYRKSDVLIVPSKKTKTWEELFGIVIIEAIISGVIPIATDHVGPKEIINNKNGFIIKESKNMHIEIYNILNKLMNNRVLMENIKNNLENESKKYDSKKILEKWLSLLLEE
jgi:glycosyltransferase involved in cell wall biosynthesis